MRGKARLTLRPGDPGTRRLTDEYGPRLVAVRYRYDEEKWRRYTTVEIIVDDVPWAPERHVSDPDREVGLRVGWGEEAIRRDLRDHRARWDPRAKLWWLPLGTVTLLRLEERIAAWAPVEKGEISRRR
jgi:hypothetical protein